MDTEARALNQINQKKNIGYKFLYDQYYCSLCSFAYKFIKQHDHAEDIVQDVIMRLWNSNSSFNTISALRSFLYYSVRNASLNFIRDNTKLSGTELQNSNDALLIVSDNEAIEQEIIEEEFYRKIHAAIEKLSPERKSVILLSMEGLSNKEISEKQGISVNTVKSLKLRAYKVLRNELGMYLLMFLISISQ